MSIAENLASIKKNIKKQTSGPVPNIIAVSKKQSDARLEEALAAGLSEFGENRVQEAYDHWQTRKQKNEAIKLHLIGPLQSNKVKEAVSLFDYIHTVDREKIARKLGDEMQTQGKNIPCFIQVNTGREDQKSGIDVDSLEAFYDFCVTQCGLTVIGLMVIPPVDESPLFHFALLKKKAKALGLEGLSMGMSSDYEEATRMGATHLRIGSALLGERD